MSVKVDIVGATGYTGQELIDILLKHHSAVIGGLYSTTDKPQDYASLVPRFSGRLDRVCRKFDTDEICSSDSQAVFLALPHTQAMGCAASLLKSGKVVIDLSADFRLKNTIAYERFYNIKHKSPSLLKSSVYGLPELYRSRILKSRLIANPGCYPTGAILGLAPLFCAGLIAADSVVIDAKSGTSGAGKKAVQDFLFTEVDEDFRAYKVNNHQHIPEIDQELAALAKAKVGVTFVPHLLPLKRGILETIYCQAKGKKKLSARELLGTFRRFYKHEPFIRIKQEGQFPALKDVAGTNFCDIGIGVFGKTVIVISAIDNLVKGAAGQAVQNFNIVFGFPETTGLL